MPRRLPRQYLKFQLVRHTAAWTHDVAHGEKRSGGILSEKNNPLLPLPALIRFAEPRFGHVDVGADALLGEGSA